MATEGKRDYTHLLKHSLIQTQDQWVQPMGAIRKMGITRSWSMGACVDAEGRWLALRAPGRRRARARRAARGQAGSSSELEQPALAPSRARRLTCGASYGPPGRASRSGASRSSGRSARSRTR